MNFCCRICKEEIKIGDKIIRKDKKLYHKQCYRDWKLSPVWTAYLKGELTKSQ